MTLRHHAEGNMRAVNLLRRSAISSSVLNERGGRECRAFLRRGTSPKAEIVERHIREQPGEEAPCHIDRNPQRRTSSGRAKGSSSAGDRSRSFKLCRSAHEDSRKYSAANLWRFV